MRKQTLALFSLHTSTFLQDSHEFMSAFSGSPAHPYSTDTYIQPLIQNCSVVILLTPPQLSFTFPMAVIPDFMLPSNGMHTTALLTGYESWMHQPWFPLKSPPSLLDLPIPISRPPKPTLYPSPPCPSTSCHSSLYSWLAWNPPVLRNQDATQVSSMFPRVCNWLIAPPASVT